MTYVLRVGCLSAFNVDAGVRTRENDCGSELRSVKASFEDMTSETRLPS